MSLRQVIAQILEMRGVKISDSQVLAKAILGMSDYYIQNPKDDTPWQDPSMLLAQVVYYFPLNYLRATQVYLEGQRFNFFSGLEHIIDFGAGLGAGSLPLLEAQQFKAITFVEKSGEAHSLHKTILEKMIPQILESASFRWVRQKEHIEKKVTSLGIFSYSLTEIQKLPEWAFELEALMILEPSTRDDGRHLLDLREQLLQRGYSIWAPCLHQQHCPLQKESKSDWCHDRIHWVQPEWFEKIERSLPIKNQTITFSYLLARKTPPGLRPSHLGRLTGDLLKEKGKNKQLICRGSKREFIAWLTRKGEAPEFPRGVLLQLPPNLEEKGNELRVNETQPELFQDSRH